MKSLSSLVLASMLAVGCNHGDRNKSNTQQADQRNLNGAGYTLSESGSFTHKENEMSGSGTVVFTIPTKDKDNSYSLTFTLADAGSLTLTANAGRGLRSGISIQFTRAGAALKASLKSGSTEVDISSKFRKIDSSKEMIFQIDMHNSESPTHILVWANPTEFSEDSALFNSETDAEAPGQGGGNIWGLVLVNAVVTSAATAEPKFEE